ncbi:MAG TPA: histidine kinase dimerization/phospho-acceptor domain-containing protein, partial [Salinimicrobium sp.]|nr:histidine kinase dimerization/phospho-acceptor domain-containing protein [Salinimicrobium sp.]
MKNIHRLITETVPLFFFTYNPKRQVIEYVSPQFYDFINHGEEIDGLSPHNKLRAVINEDERQKFDQFFHDLARKNKYESSVELRTQTDKCKIEWFELNTFRPSKQLNELLIVGHIVDITGKKKQYEILKKENHSIENVMNMMAHDLKAPLANINLIVSLIEEMMPKEDLKKFEKYLKTLKDTSKDSGKLINKLLDLATLKGETSKMDLDLHDLCYTID